MSSKLCEFIEEEVYHFILKSILFDFLLAPLGALSAPKIKVACVMATLFSYGRDSFQMLRYHFCTSFLSWFLHILFLGINIKAVSIDNSNISFHSFRTWHQRELVRCGARVWDALLLWPFLSNGYDIKRIMADVHQKWDHGGIREKALISEIPDTRNTQRFWKNCMDRVLKKISGSGRVSGTRWALVSNSKLMFG